MSRIYLNPLNGRKYKAELSLGSGKSRRRKTKTFNEASQAKQWLHQMELDYDQGTTYEMANWRFLDYYRHWLDLYKRPMVSPNTLDTYMSSYAHYEKYFDNVKVEDLTRNRIQGFLNQLNLSHETGRKDLQHIRSCLRDAVSDGVLSRNPAEGNLQIIADVDRTKADDKKFMPISSFRKIRDFLLSYRYHLADVNRLALMIISQSGLRIGECLALKYEDVDFLHHTLRVDESWDSVHGILKEPKTKHAKRTLPLPEAVLHLLSRWIHYHKQVLFKKGIKNPDNFLLFNMYGRLPASKNVNASYHQLQIRLGLPAKFSTHTLRHTLASLMIANEDISMVYVSKYLGHASVAITQQYYIGLLPEQVEVEADKVLKVIAE
ncbi:integrase [Lactiplantibacillus plantarum]|uniref:tyrosine-type recombinase/integrase n=1 Tax=Lactiplantibacillus plantarum TaxID=1590 RepID=UPI000935493C|nr:site-specific integrase [Lactiplantibacillus plantarum]MBO2714937.1 tyrosine-type recombinase/integrase [Lactiplantibacillus plantarum]MCG0758389.1 integrase [Lactiplantibacillus plantarum]MCG0775671.1 integrase [Lactiplantibacillus plantarum]MCG0868587.1 integrase [Lactiplantibacillus plantarum]QGX70003.1 tyrosine-type recombinase/integrase [Lactiplantibacillus plantarum]